MRKLFFETLCTVTIGAIFSVFLTSCGPIGNQSKPSQTIEDLTQPNPPDDDSSDDEEEEAGKKGDTGKEKKKKSKKKTPSKRKKTGGTSTSSEVCEPFGAEERRNVNGFEHEFYSLAENTSRFTPPNEDQNVYVIGDIHGSWEMIQKVMISSGLMFLEPANPILRVSIRYNSRDVQVDIPNLIFSDPKTTPKPAKKVIFVGDYIAKCSDERAQITLALLENILAKQALLANPDPSVVAVLGNHDFEAVNGVFHGGYPSEKRFRDQVLRMIQAKHLSASYAYHGVWYTHSYVTPTDVNEFGKEGIDFSQHSSLGLEKLSQSVNQVVENLIFGDKVKSSWLASEHEHGNIGIFNFFYVMSGLPANFVNLAGLSDNFPIIMGHLSDFDRMVPRILTEGYHGTNKSQFPLRAHILCIDTSIYRHYIDPSTDKLARYIRISYSSSPSKVEFQKCTQSTD